MTAPDPATMCTDIHRWLTLLADRLDAATGLHAARPTAPRSTHPRPGALPHGLTAALDQLDDGMPGARTPHGITTILTGWADDIADRRAEPRTLPATLYLAATATWWRDHYGDADALTDDITTAWTRLATATGHTDITDPARRCPACGGRLTQGTTPRGLTDWRICTACDSWWPDGDTIDAAAHHTITTTTDGGHWITRSLALHIHPALTPATLRQWIHRHVVRARGPLISLDDLNTRMNMKETP